MTNDSLAHRYVRMGFLLTLAVIGMGLVACATDSDEETTPTGTLSGTVIEPVSGLPVVGASVTIETVAAKNPRTTTTDNSGVYFFNDVPEGSWLLTVDASDIVVDAGNPDLEYAGFSGHVDVEAGETTENDAYVPVIDVTEGEDVNDGEAIILEPESIPGLRIEIAADATTFPDGTTDGTLNVAQLGFDQGPAPLEAGFATAMTIQILPQGTTFDPPATITFPNRDEVDVDTVMDVYTYDGSGWSFDFTATAGEGGVVSDQGEGISVASTHFLSCAPGTIRGEVFDLEQNPLQGVDVQIYARVNPFGESDDLVALDGVTATTDASGQFTVSDVRACWVSFGANYASVDAAGHLEPWEAQPRDDSGTTNLGTRQMELTTETTFVVSGTVRFHDGTVAPEITVGWYDADEPFSGSANISDGQGRFSVSITAAPGADIRIWGHDEFTGASGEAPIDVPPLVDSGITVENDLHICTDNDTFGCGEWGTWELNGNVMALQMSELECGGSVRENPMDITILTLQDGVMELEFEEDEETIQDLLFRVGGTGPSGVNATNLPGIYMSEDSGMAIAIYPDGTMNTITGPDNPETSVVQYGTYEIDGSSLVVTFEYSNDGDTEAGDTIEFPFVRNGDSLVFDPEGDADSFTSCEYGNDQGSVENTWLNPDDEGGFALILFDGEFVARGF